MELIRNTWDDILKTEYTKKYFLELSTFLDEEYVQKTVYPPREQIFRALEIVDYRDVRVVILGQDPYHGPGQANGMAFAVGDGIPLPPSLINIYKEIEDDLGVKMSPCGTLAGWAKQGVLLLNSVLTVRRGEAYSHSQIGWQKFTDAVIMSLNDYPEPIVYVLWGAGAIAKKEIIDKKHYILMSPHPSPLSAHRGFFGSKPFSKANDFLKKHGHAPIDWSNTDGFEPAGYYKHSGKIKRV